MYDANGTLIKKIFYPYYNTVKYVISPNGAHIIMLGTNYCKEWHDDKWTSLFVWPHVCAFNPSAVCYSMDGQQIAIGSTLGQIQIFCIRNIDEPKLVRQIYTGIYQITSLCYTPDGTELLSGNSVSIIKKWNVRNGGMVRVYHCPWDGGPVFDIMYSPNHQQIAYRYGNFCCVCSPINSKITHLYHVIGISCITFSPNSRSIITGDQDGNIMELNLLESSMFINKINKLGYPIQCICTTYPNYHKINLLKKHIELNLSIPATHHS
jgi:WD40 repeat protein